MLVQLVIEMISLIPSDFAQVGMRKQMSACPPEVACLNTTGTNISNIDATRGFVR